jgi:hypothetical protein
MKTAHGLLVHTALRAPGRHSARSENWHIGPLALSASHAPGRHSAWSQNRPVGPLALSASRALGRNRGLGRERRFPPGPRLGPVIVSHPFSSNGRTRNPAEQNRTDALALTLAFTWFLRSLFHAAASNRPSSSTDERPSAGGRSMPRRRLEPLASVRAHRWVDAPPSSGLSGVSSRPRAPTRWRASAPSRFQCRALIHKRCASEILSPTTRQLAVVRVLPARLTDPRLADPRPMVVCEVMQVSVDPYSFSSD